MLLFSFSNLIIFLHNFCFQELGVEGDDSNVLFPAYEYPSIFSALNILLSVIGWSSSNFLLLFSFFFCLKDSMDPKNRQEFVNTEVINAQRSLISNLIMFGENDQVAPLEIPRDNTFPFTNLEWMKNCTFSLSGKMKKSWLHYKNSELFSWYSIVHTVYDIEMLYWPHILGLLYCPVYTNHLKLGSVWPCWWISLCQLVFTHTISHVLSCSI